MLLLFIAIGLIAGGLAGAGWGIVAFYGVILGIYLVAGIMDLFSLKNTAPAKAVVVLLGISGVLAVAAAAQ